MARARRKRGKVRGVTREAALRRVRALERALEGVKSARAAERTRHARQLATLKRSADRRLSSMLRELAALRHHEARAQALERLLAERDAALIRAAQAASERPAGDAESR